MNRKLTCSNYFIIQEKRFSREHTQNPNANVRALTNVTFCHCWISFPPESHLAFHIYYVKNENTLTCKRISLDSGGGMMMY